MLDEKIHIAASLRLRISAGFIDVAICYAIWYLVHSSIVDDLDSTWFLVQHLTEFWLISTFFYFITWEWLLGATPGKFFMNIRVSDIHMQKPGLLKIILRNTIKFVSIGVVFVGYLMVYFRSDKRALHDILSSTLVLKAR